MYSECSRFHPNQFTFGRVIAEHMNTVVNPYPKHLVKIGPVLSEIKK